MIRPLFALVTASVLSLSASAAPPDPAVLAAKIDARIDEKLKTQGVKPAAPASDSEFHRRASLDILGRIPTVAEARAFLDDQSTDKRAKLIDKLLVSPTAISHAATQWRYSLVTQPQRVQFIDLTLEAWFRSELRAGRTVDRLMYNLLTTPLDYNDRTPEGKLRPVPGPSPLAFYQASELKPGTVAANAARVLLGIRIECAQCHNHPFDKWTQKQYWESAAFFAPVPPQDPFEAIKPFAELSLRNTARINEVGAEVTPKLLDGTLPDWKGVTDTRQAFAKWATSKTNPFFARTMANRVWSQFFGVGIVDPIDDFSPENAASHPELLNELAEALIAADFDTNVLAKAIGRTAAYQRSSKGTEKAQNNPRLFARMNVKGLSPEQLFDSLAQATGYREDVPVAARVAFGADTATPRGQYLAKFAGGTARPDAQTSMLQALTLMNGNWMARATDPTRGETLIAVANAPFLDDAAKIETLFLAAYSRKPTATEREKFLSLLLRENEANRKTQLADIFWSLLNSQEFLLNH